MTEGFIACCVPQSGSSALGRVICCRGTSDVLHSKAGRPNRDDAFLHEVAGRWPQFAGVVKLHPGKEGGDLVVFAELNRVPSGVLGGRVGTIASCVKLRGDGFGSLGLSSCNESTEKVAYHQGVVGKLSNGGPLTALW